MMAETSTKTFSDLQADVITPGRCDYCSACVTFCHNEGFDALTLADEVFTLDEEKCTDCGMCYLSCHMATALVETVYDDYGVRDSPLGRYRRITSASSSDQQIKAIATDGGVVTAYMSYLLEAGLVDGAILARPLGEGRHEHTVVTTPATVRECAGSRFNPLEGALRDDRDEIYNLQMITYLRQQDFDPQMRLAAVGTPCQVHALRRMQALDIRPARQVRYVVGLFCFENVALTPERVNLFEDLAGTPIANIVKMNLKDQFQLTLENGETRFIGLEELMKVSNPSCSICADYSNRLADLSVGGHGSVDGFTTVVLRTEAGARSYQMALAAGALVEYDTLFPGSADPGATETRLRDSVIAICRRKDQLVSQ